MFIIYMVHTRVYASLIFHIRHRLSGRSNMLLYQMDTAKLICVNLLIVQN